MMQVGAKENLARQLTKALGDAEMWKQKYEIDGMAKAEELEMARLKLQARLSEGQAVVEQFQAQIMHTTMEKKARQFDRIVGEWKNKVDSLTMDLDNAQKETRNVSSELFKVDQIMWNQNLSVYMLLYVFSLHF